MSVEVNLVGTKCGAKAGGLSCTYCYQAPVRRGDGNAGGPAPDHQAIQKAVLASGCTPRDGFSLFGGEPLLASIEDIEKVWAFGLEKFGKNGVQTSGRPITEEHIALFHRYKVHVGFSIDGPGDHNEARVAGDRLATRKATDHSIAALKRCLAEGIGASVICTLSTHNASPSRLPGLLDWFRELEAVGLRDARLHHLELDSPFTKLIALTDEENEAALVACHELEKTTRLRFDVFKDIRNLLRADDQDVTCVFTGCDPWRTTAVHGIGADGSRYMCERVHKDGRRWSPAQPGPLIRQLVLANTPQSDGGCQGCRFMITCKGQCPGTAIDGDWRKRSRDCRLWFSLFERIERELEEEGEVPVTKRPDLPTIEGRMIGAWEAGIQATVKACVNGDIARTVPDVHGHIDVPHEDWHHDHTDTGGAQ